VNEVHWQREQLAGCLVVRPAGALDALRYRDVRDTVINFALDQPRAVIVAIDALDLPDPNALTAFPSAALHVSDWPGVPIVVVTGRADQRALLDGTRVSRFIPVFDDVAAAVGAARQPPRRRLAALELSDGCSVLAGRAFSSARPANIGRSRNWSVTPSRSSPNWWRIRCCTRCRRRESGSNCALACSVSR
jgi:hypothetical protein